MHITSAEVNEIIGQFLQEGNEVPEVRDWLHSKHPIPDIKCEVEFSFGVALKRVTHFTVNGVVFELKDMMIGRGIEINSLKSMNFEYQDYYKNYSVQIPQVIKSAIIDHVKNLTIALL